MIPYLSYVTNHAVYFNGMNLTLQCLNALQEFYVALSWRSFFTVINCFYVCTYFSSFVFFNSTIDLLSSRHSEQLLWHQKAILESVNNRLCDNHVSILFKKYYNMQHLLSASRQRSLNCREKAFIQETVYHSVIYVSHINLQHDG